MESACDPAVGTISTGGLYTAPSSQALSTTVTVTATHTEDSTLTASATATVVNAAPAAVAAKRATPVIPIGFETLGEPIAEGARPAPLPPPLRRVELPGRVVRPLAGGNIADQLGERPGIAGRFGFFTINPG